MEDGVQKYQKVYNFLKRTLSQERYEGIRLIEPCVVVAQGFNKAFKYAVLGDEMLYVTENPPKTSRDINMTIDLSTITSVGVIHDYPEFLNGDLKSKAQHIVIQYKDLTFKVGSSSSVKLALSASVLGTSPVMSSESFLQGEKLDVHTSSPRRTSYLSVSRTLTEQVGYMRLSASESDLRTKLRQERSNLQSSSGDVSPRPLPVPPTAYRTSDYSDYKSTRPKKKCPTSKQNIKEKTERNPELNSSSSSAELDFFSYAVCASDSPVVQRPSSLPYSSESLVNQRLSPPGMIQRPSSPCSIPNSKETRADLRQCRVPSTESNSSMQGSSDESADETDSIENSDSTTEVHLYVLTEHSPMFMYLRSTWNNCVLKSTLHIGSSKSSLTPTASSTRIQYSKVDNSQLRQLFYQLKSEILQSQHMEKSFVLVQELLTAAQKSFVLKKFFWKSPDLFTFIVGQLQLYLPQSPSSSQAKKRKLNRADELEPGGVVDLSTGEMDVKVSSAWQAGSADVVRQCQIYKGSIFNSLNKDKDEADFIVILLELLVCMFRETEVLMPRLNVLKSSKGRSVHELVRTIVKTPKVKTSEDSDGISHAAQMLLMAGRHEQVNHPQRDNEMSKLLEEIIDGACAVMHEVILAVQQAKCYASDDKVLNIYWLMKILESQEAGVPFLERMMQRSMALVQCRSKLLSPKEAVLLFRQFYVLQSVLEYSESLAQFVQTAYAEEFRYYIKQHIIRKKLSSNYPITGPLLRAVERVSGMVLSHANSKSSMR